MTVVASQYKPRPDDFYETEEWAVRAATRSLKLLGLWQDRQIWEPTAGNHAIVKPLIGAGATTVITSDIRIHRIEHDFIHDFVQQPKPDHVTGSFDIITNPPYGNGNRLAVAFAEQALRLCEGYVALLLTAKFDFGNTRQHLFKNNPRFRAKVALGSDAGGGRILR